MPGGLEPVWNRSSCDGSTQRRRPDPPGALVSAWAGSRRKARRVGIWEMSEHPLETPLVQCGDGELHPLRLGLTGWRFSAGNQYGLYRVVLVDWAELQPPIFALVGLTTGAYYWPFLSTQFEPTPIPPSVFPKTYRRRIARALLNTFVRDYRRREYLQRLHSQVLQEWLGETSGS